MGCSALSEGVGYHSFGIVISGIKSVTVQDCFLSLVNEFSSLFSFLSVSKSRVATSPGKPGKCLEFKKWSGKPGKLKK